MHEAGTARALCGLAKNNDMRDDDVWKTEWLHKSVFDSALNEASAAIPEGMRVSETIDLDPEQPRRAVICW